MVPSRPLMVPSRPLMSIPHFLVFSFFVAHSRAMVLAKSFFFFFLTHRAIGRQRAEPRDKSKSKLLDDGCVTTQGRRGESVRIGTLTVAHHNVFLVIRHGVKFCVLVRCPGSELVTSRSKKDPCDLWRTRSRLQRPRLHSFSLGNPRPVPVLVFSS